MTQDILSLVRELAEQYDTENKNTFVTVYFNKTEDPHYFERRESACAAALTKKEQSTFQETMEKINSFLKKTSEQYGGIFASSKYEFFKTITFAIPIYNALIVDTSPYIRPLLRVLDEWESFTLVFLDSHTAKIIDITLGRIKDETNLSEDIINKHKKGGQSQARFQRRRKGAIKRFLKEITEALENQYEPRIILAGPGTTKIHFHDQLPKKLQEKIVDILDIDISDEQQLIQKSLDIISTKEKEQSKQNVNLLKKEILTDGLGVYGFKDTLQAAQQGKVDVLLVEKDFHVKGCICEHCQIVKSGPVKDCPVCGQTTSEADVIEEIIEYAERTNATIEFSDDPLLSELGHIGALLRFK